MEQIGEEFRARYGRRVKEIREAAGMTQAQLAARLTEQGLRAGHTTIAKIEAGTRTTTFEEALAIADALGQPGVERFLQADPVEDALKHLTSQFTSLATAAREFLDARRALVAALDEAVATPGWVPSDPKRITWALGLDMRHVGYAAGRRLASKQVTEIVDAAQYGPRDIDDEVASSEPFEPGTWLSVRQEERIDGEHQEAP
ncbi:helix-turn-helix transcriptional regulator [Isoptericola sp. NPDC056618]|uniref:helix-turn-helix transcriptional regulator n=1 Tax=Isoptericola sp. NPDC056618 TaxID=3345878 RepID=UPI0036BBF683